MVDCVCNTVIPCNAKELESFGSKRPASMTIVGIVRTGFSWAPWKKPAKKATKEPRDPNSKDLFEDPKYADAQGQRVLKSVKMYSFSKVDGRQADKGPRDEDTWSIIYVGQTIQFKFHDFM